MCDLLKDPSKYDGRLVQVRDHTIGTSEGVWFVSQECPGVFVTEGYEWDGLISITYPGNFDAHPVDFRLNLESRRRLKKKYARVRRQAKPECVEWTLTGLFETRTTWKHNVNGVPIGFGHQGQAPAQLIVKSEDDVAAIPNCPSRGNKKQED